MATYEVLARIYGDGAGALAFAQRFTVQYTKGSMSIARASGRTSVADTLKHVMLARKYCASPQATTLTGELSHLSQTSEHGSHMYLPHSSEGWMQSHPGGG